MLTFLNKSNREGGSIRITGIIIGVLKQEGRKTWELESVASVES